MNKEFILIDSENRENALVAAAKSGNEWKALCPFHNDVNPSLSINKEKGVYYCHGCNKRGKIYTENISHSLPNRIVAIYDYRDENGELLFQAIRYDPKRFAFRRPNDSDGWVYNLDGVRRVPYKLPDIIGSSTDTPILVVEGEKDVDNLKQLGFVATTSPMGARKWKKEYNKYFENKIVVLIPDNDEQGKLHCLEIGKNLKDITSEVKWLELPDLEPGGDISDWISMGGTKEKLQELIKNTRIYIDISPNEKFNPKIYADYLIDKYRLGSDTSGRLWFYDSKKGIWVVDAVRDLKSILRKKVLREYHLKKFYVSEVIDEIKDREYIRNGFSEPDINLIPFNNKIYNLKNDEMIDFNPEYHFINKLPVNVNSENKECPLIDRIFAELVGESRKEILYELSAYCMFRSYPYQKIFFLYGVGRNGKSTFINILTRLIGENNVSNINLNELSVNKFATSQFYGKLINICGELDMNTIKRTSMLKQLTGGDRIKSEKKFKEAFYFRNYAKVIIMTNKLPETHDNTDAFYRRVNLVEFPNKFEGTNDDKTILDKISEQEYQSYAWKCLEILRLLRERGYVMSNDMTIQQLRGFYDKLSSPLAEYLKANIENDVSGEIASDEFSVALSLYLADKNIPEWSKIRINKEMKGRGYELRTKGVTCNGISTTKQFWMGIKWK